MSNLKKILALVLALVMSFSLVTVSSAAFTDEADINATFTESAEVLASLGVFKGYTDGSFNPKGSITRAEVAAIIYRVATGDVNDKQVSIYADYNVFSDVNSNAWYAGYVNYCANAQYIKGYGNGKFGPNDTVTGYQALAMILRAVGYDKNGEFTGASWQVETAKIGTQLGITKNVTAVLLGTAASREVVAEILFRAINVPQVNYTLALGYSQYQNNGLTTTAKNPSLAAKFGLTQVNGVVEYAVPGYAVVGNTAVYASDLTWENVGYIAYVWAVPTASDKTLTAVSSSVVYGDSLLVNTDDTSYGYLTTYVVDVEADADVYYNGVKLPSKVVNPLTGKQDVEMTVAQALAKVGQVGVKVDFIDNDFGGIAEAVVVTEYTVASVSGIANEQNTGTNAIVKDTYYFNNGFKTSVKKLVTADDLAVGDLFTYVVYGGYTYADEVDYAMGEFTKINYSQQYAAETYVIGDVEYVKAHKFAGNAAVLGRGYVGKDLIVGTDPYGYMLVVAENVPADNYLYVIRYNHPDTVAGTIYATVAFADGTVENVYVDSSNIGDYFLNRTFANHMFTYTVENGVYELVDWCCTNGDNMHHPYYTINWYNADGKTTEFFNHHLTKSTVVVDLRDVIDRTGDVKVYNGYAEVPSILNMSVRYVAVNGFITLAFIVDGVNYADLESEFILYTTLYSSYYIDENDNKMFVMDAIVDGEKTTVTLDEDRYEFVKNHGVGVYSFWFNGVYDEMYYTSFMESWYDVKWQNGTIVLDGIGSYAYDDIVKFWTLDVANRKAYNYLPTAGSDLTDAHAYLVWDQAANGTWFVEEIYIVYGTLAPVAEDFSNYTATKDTGFYFAADKYVTNFLTNAEVAYGNALRLIKVTNAAIEAATAILDNAGLLTADLDDEMFVGSSAVASLNAADFETEVEYALAVLEAAKADLATAVSVINAVKAYLSDEQVEDANEVLAEVAEVVAEVEETIADAEAKIEEDAAADKEESDAADALKALQAEKVASVKAALETAIETEAAAAGIYKLAGDVYVAEDDVYVVAGDIEFTYEKATTTLATLIASWTAKIQAATTELAISTAAPTKTVIENVAKAFVAFLADLI